MDASRYLAGWHPFYVARLTARIIVLCIEKVFILRLI